MKLLPLTTLNIQPETLLFTISDRSFSLTEFDPDPCGTPLNISLNISLLDVNK